MFGLSDRLYALLLSKYKELEDSNQDINWTPQHRTHEGLWLCFLPSFAYNSRKLRKRILPQEGNLWVCEVPQFAIQTNPSITREILERVSEAGLEIINASDVANPSFLGVSLGNAPAFYLANQTGSTGRLVSIAPGSYLPECIRESVATAHIIKKGLKRGYLFEDYIYHLSQFSPSNNLYNLQTQTEVHLGRYDLMIPYKRGKELTDQLQKRNNTRVTINAYQDHVSLIRSFQFNSS